MRESRFRLIVVDRLFGTVAFEDFSLQHEGKEELPLVLQWWMRIMPSALLHGHNRQRESQHETVFAAADTNNSLHAIIISPVAARRPQGLAPPPLSSPIIIMASSSEPFSATEISAAGAQITQTFLFFGINSATFCAFHHPAPRTSLRLLACAV
jgi:hypothetical protein